MTKYNPASAGRNSGHLRTAERVLQTERATVGTPGQIRQAGPIALGKDPMIKFPSHLWERYWNPIVCLPKSYRTTILTICL